VAEAVTYVVSHCLSFNITANFLEPDAISEFTDKGLFKESPHFFHQSSIRSAKWLIAYFSSCF
jgi:hypothetical protein